MLSLMFQRMVALPEPQGKLSNVQLYRRNSMSCVQPGPFCGPKLDPEMGLVGVGCAEAWDWESGICGTSQDDK